MSALWRGTPGLGSRSLHRFCHSGWHRTVSTSLVFALSASVAGAQTAQPLPPAAAPGPAAKVLPSVSSDAMTVTRWHKQNVYDPSDAKIGAVEDVLVDRDGKIVAFIVAVGGFLGMGEKDVAVPFNAVQFKAKDNNK
jgi:sporulation protein YlmC with PRC-barrel domain